MLVLFSCTDSSLICRFVPTFFPSYSWPVYFLHSFTNKLETFLTWFTREVKYTLFSVVWLFSLLYYVRFSYFCGKHIPFLFLLESSTWDTPIQYRIHSLKRERERERDFEWIVFPKNVDKLTKKEESGEFVGEEKKKKKVKWRRVEEVKGESKLSDWFRIMYLSKPKLLSFFFLSSA